MSRGMYHPRWVKTMLRWDNSVGVSLHSFGPSFFHTLELKSRELTFSSPNRVMALVTVVLDKYHQVSVT